MEISNSVREVIYFGLVLFFVGSLFYSFVIADKVPSKKFS